MIFTSFEYFVVILSPHKSLTSREAKLNDDEGALQNCNSLPLFHVRKEESTAKFERFENEAHVFIIYFCHHWYIICDHNVLRYLIANRLFHIGLTFDWKTYKFDLPYTANPAIFAGNQSGSLFVTV
jgi:hypothetical protein